MFVFIEFVLHFLVLAISLDILDMLCSSRLLVHMVTLISMFLVMLYLLFLYIKYHGKFFIFLTLVVRFHRTNVESEKNCSWSL
jgi:hypothetical protein